MNTQGIWTNSERMSGKPCIRGTRFAVSQFLCELADGRSIGQIAEDFDLDYEMLEQALVDLSCTMKEQTNEV